MKIRTLDDFDINGKTVLLRVDMNVPIDPKTKQITGSKRIGDVAITVNALNGAKIVIISPVSYTHLTLPTNREV